METKQFGIKAPLLAFLAFLLAAFTNPLAVLLVVGLAVLAYKDEWLNKQVLQALLLSIVLYLTCAVCDWVFGGFSTFLGWVSAFGAANVFAVINRSLQDVFGVIVILVCVFSAFKVLRGNDANLPVLAKLASQAPDAFAPKPAPAQYQYQAPVAPAAPAPAPQAPAASQAPASQAPASQAVSAPQTAPEGKTCPQCHAALAEGSHFCTSCGTRIE